MVKFPVEPKLSVGASFTLTYWDEPLKVRQSPLLQFVDHAGEPAKVPMLPLRLLSDAAEPESSSKVHQPARPLVLAAKFAVTVVVVVIGTVHVPVVPEQPAPGVDPVTVQLEMIYPAAGMAVNVSIVPCATELRQVVELHKTVPSADGEAATVSPILVEKFAVTVVLAVTATVQVPVIPEQSAPGVDPVTVHPRRALPDAGLAVNTTEVP